MRTKQIKNLVFATVSEGDLQRPDFFRMIGCEMHLGKPRRKSSTLHYLVIFDLPKERTSFEVLTRVLEVGVGIVSPHAIGGGILLVNLTQSKAVCPLQKYAVHINHESHWELLLEIKPEFIIFQLKSMEVSKDFFDWLVDKEVAIPVILHLPSPMDYKELKAVKGVWLDMASDLESRRHAGIKFFQSVLIV